MRNGRRIWMTLVVVALFMSTTHLWSQEHQPPKVRQTPVYLADDEARSSTLYERVLPTVVTILTAEQVLTSEGQEIHEGLGSGVLISEERHVLTAAFIQTDAAINSGNSGGPVFNSKGEVIGIASRILTVSGGFQGLGFVVTINTAKQLLALEDRTWMGIESLYFTREQLAALLNLDLGADGGLLVQRVAKGSPAEKAGVRGGTIPVVVLGQEILLGGDLILAFDTQETCHEQCLVHAHSHLSGLDRIRVSYLRGGKRLETEVDVSAARRNFLSNAENGHVDQ